MRGEVTVRIGERDWTARPSFEAVEAIERAIGPIGAVKRRQLESWVSATDVARVLYECIRTANTPPSGYTGPSYGAVGAEVVARSLPAFVEPFTELVNAFLGIGRPETGEGKDEAPPAPSPTPSHSDGSSGQP